MNTPNYPWFSLGSNKYNHSKGSPLEELFNIREKGFVASKHTMFYEHYLHWGKSDSQVA